MHANGTAPLEASSEEASTSAYSRITVQLQEATENAFAEKRKKKQKNNLHPACCILMIIPSIVHASVTTLTWKTVSNMKKDSSGSIPLI